MDVVRFVADRLAVKPVKKDGELSVELFTGVYAIPALASAFLWQAQESNLEVVIRQISPERAGAVLHGKAPERVGMEEKLVGEEDGKVVQE